MAPRSVAGHGLRYAGTTAGADLTAHACIPRVTLTPQPHQHYEVDWILGRYPARTDVISSQ
jgi:hypothetical protein